MAVHFDGTVLVLDLPPGAEHVAVVHYDHGSIGINCCGPNGETSSQIAYFDGDLLRWYWNAGKQDAYEPVPLKPGMAGRCSACEQLLDVGHAKLHQCDAVKFADGTVLC